MKDLELLGLRVKDRVSGLTGVCESISYDLYGCIQAVVRPAADDKGVVPDGRWFDVSRLIVLDTTPVMEIPGGRFTVTRSKNPQFTANQHGAAEKPAR